MSLQLEDLSQALVDSVTSGLAAAVQSETLPQFAARWDYSNAFDLKSAKPTDPADVLFMPKTESLDINTPVDLFGDFLVDIGVRQKIEGYTRDRVKLLRELTDNLFYYWAPRSRRLVEAVGMTWAKTDIQVIYVPEDLVTRHLFFAVATLTFQGVRDAQ